MSMISRLPESTTRLLGSPLVITTPDTLVKELLENSIDAKATSVEVIVSVDTVKKIEVRDNGVGIHPDDYDSLGRHGHTSKLRSFDELSIQSSKTLGFRGEALASANSLAQVTITTKTISEPVAAILHIIPGIGGVSKQQPVSAPVGTTVNITGLFSRLPVREQLAVKESNKTIDRIRELLRSYAMARPNLKLSFKVIQSAKQSWSYSPKPNATVREAATQLFGAEFTAHYIEKTFQKISSTSEGDTPIERQKSPSNGQYTFEAFILKPDSPPSKVPEQRYFSVDGRPITAKRGTIKKVLNIYVEHIITAFQQAVSGITPKDCFIRLNIKCPPGSYDVNIEPSKDDVLFSNEMGVLDGFKNLCKEVYKTPIPNSSDSRLSAKRSPVLGDGDANVQQEPSVVSGMKPGSEVTAYSDLSSKIQNPALPQSGHVMQSQGQQAPTTDLSSSAPLQDLDVPTSSPPIIRFTAINAPVPDTQHRSKSAKALSPGDMPSNVNHTRYKVDMSTDFNEYSHDYPRKKYRPSPQAHPSHEESGDTQHSGLRGVNPWIIAKMNAPSRDMRERVADDCIHRSNSPLPAIEGYMTPDPPILRHAGAAPRDLDVPPSQRYLQLQGNTLTGVPGGAYRSPMSSPPNRAPRREMDVTIPTPMRPRQRGNLPPWSPPSSIEMTRPSIKDLDSTGPRPTSDGLHQTTISFQGSRGSRKRRFPEEGDQIDQGLHDQCSFGENDARRTLKPPGENLSHQNLRQKPRQTPVYPKADQIQLYPHLQAGRAQDAASVSKVKEPTKTSLPSCDPRAYLLRRQKSIAADAKGTGPKKIRRLKSSLLPLENIPTDDQTHFLVLIKVLTKDILGALVKQGASYDKYVEKGVVEEGLSMSLDEGRRVEERLKSYIREQQNEAGNDGAELEIGLCTLLKGKGAVGSA
ncbi:hypothetical protein F5Y04DRAFT_288137 [Hypomontagnella monticulosa]|nr:hypothetical protein F5Y04DRAFT_288137 [Hypomontagnella monticulosa]